MLDATTIVRRILARKYPNDGRYLFEEGELVQLVERIQQDARTLDPPPPPKPRVYVVCPVCRQRRKRLSNAVITCQRGHPPAEMR